MQQDMQVLPLIQQVMQVLPLMQQGHAGPPIDATNQYRTPIDAKANLGPSTSHTGLPLMQQVIKTYNLKFVHG